MELLYMRGVFGHSANTRFWKLGLLMAAIVMLALSMGTAEIIRSTPDLDQMLATWPAPIVSTSSGIELDSLPANVAKALISAEDRNFYGDFGVEPLSMLRALYADIKAGRIVEGGSTISEQLAKNLLGPEPSRIIKKMREIIVAVMLEHRFSKDQILELYLNRVYFGSGAYGIGAASRRYFGKSADQLTLYQAAMLVGLLPAPSAMNPLRNPSLARHRAATVLQDMVETGFLSPAQRRAVLSHNDQSRGH